MAFDTQYVQIHEAILAALANTSDPAQVSLLLSERDKARDAYMRALHAQLSASDPRLKTVVQGLKVAAQGLADQSEAQTKLDAYIGKIQTAVEWLTKLLVYVS